MTRRIGGATTVVALATATFLLLFGTVLIGRRYLVSGSLLYHFLPWSATAASHPATNGATGDPIFEFLAWLRLDADALLHLRLPLWDPFAMSGKPLLANDQSAPFSPFSLMATVFGGSAYAMSLSMLAKLWVAGVGMAVFTRALGASKTASAFAGLVYGASSFLVVWLAGQGSVAALLPWVFAAGEWYLTSGSVRRLALLAIAIGAQFFAGRPEVSLDLGIGFAIYVLVRLSSLGHQALTRLAGVAAAGLLGTAIAAVQILPFADALRHNPIVDVRASLGTMHLPLTALSSWLSPNAYGNPGVDGKLGRAPNYLESTGFIGVGAGCLAVVGVWWGWTRNRTAVAGLLLVSLFSLAVAYGPLTWLVGRLPLLAVSNNLRFLMLACFGLSALAGPGFDAVTHDRQTTGQRWLAPTLVGIAGVALVAMGALGVVFLLRGAAVDTMFPTISDMIGFWLAVALASLVAAVALLALGVSGRGRLAGAGLVGLALLEAALFVGPYTPRDRPQDVPPRSDAIAWLQSHVGDSSIAALGMSLTPETPTLYGLHDVRGYDPLIAPRLHLYWDHADPNYHEPALFTVLENPGADWLAAAGVRYLLVPGNDPLTGTIAAFQADGVTISEIPNARPFAFLANQVASASNQQDAIDKLSADPLGPIVIEGAIPSPATSANSQGGGVQVTHRAAGDLELSVISERETVLVLLQSYADGWHATVDGRDAAVMPADVLFQAVRVPAGTHAVRLRYLPASVVTGGAISLAAIAVALALLFLPLAVFFLRFHRGLGSGQPRHRNAIR